MSFTAICGCGFPIVWINVDVAKRDIERVFATLALSASRSLSAAEFTIHKPLWQTLVFYADFMTSPAQLSF